MLFLEFVPDLTEKVTKLFLSQEMFGHAPPSNISFSIHMVPLLVALNEKHRLTCDTRSWINHRLWYHCWGMRGAQWSSTSGQEQSHKWVRHHTYPKPKTLSLWIILLIKCLTSSFVPTYFKSKYITIPWKTSCTSTLRTRFAGPLIFLIMM